MPAVVVLRICHCVYDICMAWVKTTLSAEINQPALYALRVFLGSSTEQAGRQAGMDGDGVQAVPIDRIKVARLAGCMATRTRVRT